MNRIGSFLMVVLLALSMTCPADAGETLERILSQKKMKAGAVVGWPKFIIWDPKTNRHEGFLADDIQRFEELTGIKVEIVNTNWNGLIAGLQAGKYDVIMGGITPTPERSLAVAFTESYGYWYTSGLVRADGTGSSLKDLDQPGKVVTVVSGTAMHAYAQRFVKKAKVGAFTDSSTAILEVMQGRAVGYIGDSFTNYVRSRERPSELKMIKFDPRETEWGGLSHAVRYNDLELLQFLNTYIRVMKLRNWYQELTAKHDLPADTSTGPH